MGVNEQAGVVGVIGRGGHQRSNRCHGGQQAKTYFNPFVSWDYFRYRNKIQIVVITSFTILLYFYRKMTNRHASHLRATYPCLSATGFFFFGTSFAS